MGWGIDDIAHVNFPNVLLHEFGFKHPFLIIFNQPHEQGHHRSSEILHVPLKFPDTKGPRTPALGWVSPSEGEPVLT